MKVYISADIEGVTGTTHWNETELNNSESGSSREQMTAEVVAACEGALQAGATEIWVKDAHDSGRNIIASKLPREARLLRGWSGHPFTMLQELDNTFHSLALVGYHSAAGTSGSPLSHTMCGHIAWMKINETLASEFLIAAYTAAYTKTPLVFVSGDQCLCDEATGFNPNIGSVAVKQGVGNSTINIHPDEATERIRDGMCKAVGNAPQCHIPLPEQFKIEIQYRYAHRAYTYGFYPGARQTDPITIQFEHDSYFEVLRFLWFALWTN